nr:BON domain-containing protein [Chthoniobacterales bacterium]
GLMHETTDRVTGRHSPASDQQLAARVSAELGHLGCRGNLNVDAEHGTVYLRGTAIPDDVAKLVGAASSVRGVSNVVNFLTVTDNIATGGAASTPSSTGASI